MTKVLIIGGGHNGLVCGAYLAKAGLDVTVLEARSHVGGCASTVDALGARVNICNCDHILVRSTPIIEELNLGRSASHTAMPIRCTCIWDGTTRLHGRCFTAPSGPSTALEAFYPGEVDGYRRYLKAAQPVVELVTEMAQSCRPRARP